jgi:hypothetical protein
MVQLPRHRIVQIEPADPSIGQMQLKHALFGIGRTRALRLAAEPNLSSTCAIDRQRAPSCNSGRLLAAWILKARSSPVYSPYCRYWASVPRLIRTMAMPSTNRTDPGLGQSDSDSETASAIFHWAALGETNG